MQQPLLVGKMASEAKRTVREIAAALDRLGAEACGPSYATGWAGIALFYGQMATVFTEDRAAANAERCLDLALVSARRRRLLPGLHLGLTGIAWSAACLDRMFCSRPSTAATEALDEELLRLLSRSPWPAEVDLTYGLAGLGLYALDHPDDAWGDRALEHVLGRLEEMAEPVAGGMAWPESLPRPTHGLPETACPEAPSRVGQNPARRYDLGLAHGQAGIIAILARVLGRGVQPHRTRDLLDAAVRFLIAQRRSGTRGSVYPAHSDGRGGGASCRSGWCYGDLGIAQGLLAAARAAREPTWRREAQRSLRRDLVRPSQERGLRDAGLCHGSAGLAHLYHRWYRATGQSRSARAARHWFRHTLEHRRPGSGLAGFPAWWPSRGSYRPQAGLLDGEVGVGLALLSALTTQEPLWDRPLMVKPPTRPRNSGSSMRQRSSRGRVTANQAG